MAVKRYSKKEPLVFLWISIPYIFFMNVLIFGTCFVRSWTDFLWAFGISGIYFFLIYGLFGTVAVLIQRHFPRANDLFLRVRIMLPVFYIMNIGAIYGAFFMYKQWKLVTCPVQTDHYWWTVLYGCVMTTLITFINEGYANWEQWKESLSEGEKLKNTYRRTKLLGLKGQINPHFLFNCFNTLSGLITEDEDDAEQFLNDMTQVHRYLLQNDEEYLVPLKDEIKFAKAYMRLAQTRFGKAVQCDFTISDSLLSKKIPPLSLHVILENIIYTNSLTKDNPLSISITGESDSHLIIQHSIHEKIIVRNLDVDEGLDNLIMKYKLLHAEGILLTESHSIRKMVLPLFADQLIFL